VDISVGQLVSTTKEVVIQDGGFGLGFTHVPPNTTGRVRKIEGCYPPRALIIFNIDGKECKEWINSDELLPF
jgi:hypothetical protein